MKKQEGKTIQVWCPRCEKAFGAPEYLTSDEDVQIIQLSNHASRISGRKVPRTCPICGLVIAVRIKK